jgi:hypothetical protein
VQQPSSRKSRISKVQYTIAERGWTIVNIYDLLGREVTTLVNGVKQPGTYIVEFDGSRLASGVYFCRLLAGSYAETISMVIAR